jgi:hypothetical protein
MTNGEDRMKNSLKTALLLLTTLFLWTGCDSSTTETIVTPTVEDTTLLGLSGYTKVDLNATQTASLAYMWHEEKLAYDLYMELGSLWNISPMKMIAGNSEIVHMQYVEELVAWYDINITDVPDYNVSYSAAELDAMVPGTFAIPAIQALYDDLNASGQPSKVDSLQVGCIVEVTDVNDLNAYIEQSAGNQALIDTFTFLRTGSYKHYWKFHDTLEAIDGVGCAFTRDGVDYNKTGEYPIN